MLLAWFWSRNFKSDLHCQSTSSSAIIIPCPLVNIIFGIELYVQAHLYHLALVRNTCVGKYLPYSFQQTPLSLLIQRHLAFNRGKKSEYEWTATYAIVTYDTYLRTTLRLTREIWGHLWEGLDDCVHYCLSHPSGDIYNFLFVLYEKGKKK